MFFGEPISVMTERCIHKKYFCFTAMILFQPQRTPLANQVSTPRAGLPSETAEDSPIIPAGNRGRRVLISEEEEEEGDMSEEEDEEEEGDMSVSVEQSESSFNGNQVRRFSI